MRIQRQFLYIRDADAQRCAGGHPRRSRRSNPPFPAAATRFSAPLCEEEWYALFLCQDRDWNPVVGETYQMQLTGFDDYVIPAEVVSFTRIGSDLLLRMRVGTECGARAEYSHVRRNRGRFHNRFQRTYQCAVYNEQYDRRCCCRGRCADVCRRNGHFVSGCGYSVCSTGTGKIRR